MKASATVLLVLALAACSTEGGGDPPPQEKIGFEGAETLSPSDLRELVEADVRRYEADPRIPGLEDASYRLEYRYRLEGFDRVRVTSRVSEGQIIFHIEEGPRIRLTQVHFDGATVFSVEDLKQLVPGRFLGEPPPYSLRLVLMIEEGVIAAYRDRGYVDVAVTRRVSDPGSTNRVIVWFNIDEGQPYFVTEIRGIPSESELQKKTAELLGKPFTPSTGESLEASIVEYYREHGHPFATARVRPLPDKDTGSTPLDADVRPGPEAHLGELNIKGSVWTRSSFIKSRADLEPGKEFHASDLRQAEERLTETNVFKRVRVTPGTLMEEPGNLPIDVELEEKESGEASLRGGYGSFERVRVGADLTGINIWGGAESLRLGGNLSKVGYRGESELGVPYLFGSELRLGLSGYYENRQYPSFDALSRGGVVSLTYPLLKQLTGTIGVRHANIITSNVDPSVPLGDLLDFHYTALIVSPTLDLRDNALMPTRGILLTSEVSYSPSYLLSDVEFWSATGRFSFYFPFPERIVFATSFQGGVIAPIGSTTDIPIALREFAGGTNTVRGYKFEGIGPKVDGEPIGGQVFLALQSEVRFPIWDDLQGAVFIDQGGVWVDRTRVTLPDLRYAVGTGLRYITPAGALVADVGWNPHPRQGEYPVEFHLSIGFPF